LIDEYYLDQNQGVFLDIKILIGKLEDIARIKNSYRTKVEVEVLQSKLLLIEGLIEPALDRLKELLKELDSLQLDNLILFVKNEITSIELEMIRITEYLNVNNKNSSLLIVADIVNFIRKLSQIKES